MRSRMNSDRQLWLGVNQLTLSGNLRPLYMSISSYGLCGGAVFISSVFVCKSSLTARLAAAQRPYTTAVVRATQLIFRNAQLTGALLTHSHGYTHTKSASVHAVIDVAHWLIGWLVTRVNILTTRPDRSTFHLVGLALDTNTAQSSLCVY